MTKTKDLENMIEDLEDSVDNNAFWIVVIFILLMFALCIAIIAYAFYINSQLQYTSLSPCDLGLMEWEWKDIYPYSDECADLFGTNFENMCFTPIGEPTNNSTLCVTLGKLYRKECMEIYCPSDVAILVVKERG